MIFRSHFHSEQLYRRTAYGKVQRVAGAIPKFQHSVGQDQRLQNLLFRTALPVVRDPAKHPKNNSVATANGNIGRFLIVFLVLCIFHLLKFHRTDISRHPKNNNISAISRAC
uniref:(northern house mosquito) hypothetical protein n=1 Tax=Culex pipiens TaxID=7175 RepID=A0A8D8I1M2_CULPI